MARSPPSSISSASSSETKVPSSLKKLKLKAGTAFSLMHGHNATEETPPPLLQPPPEAHRPPSQADHRRIVSMPDPAYLGRRIGLQHNRSPTSDCSTDRTFVTGSPPIFDFTTFEDRYRNSGPTGVHNSFLDVTTSSRDGRRAVSDQIPGSKKSSGGSEADASITISWPDCDLIIGTLEDVLAEDSALSSFDGEELLQAHRRHDEEDRRSPSSAKTCADNTTVFAQPLSEVISYASSTLFFGNGRNGAAHVLPLVVVSCVEELYRTGIFQPNLFRTLPNRSRLLELISIFDSRKRPPDIKCSTPRPGQSTSGFGDEFGADVSLQLESTADICALFTSYLSALPEPLIPTYLFDAIWVLCDLETSPSLTKSHSYDTDPTRSALAVLLSQLLLHLLPPPNFSLLVYLLAFFSQAVLVNEENGVDIRDLAKMFGARLFGNGSTPTAPGPPTTSNSKGRTKDKHHGPHEEHPSTTRGEIMMAWFLRRWTSIFDSLFDVVEDARMGVYRRNKRLRKDSLGRPALQRWRENALKRHRVQDEHPQHSKARNKGPRKSKTVDSETASTRPEGVLAAFRFPPPGSSPNREPGRSDQKISPTTVMVPDGPYEARFRAQENEREDPTKEFRGLTKQAVPLAPARSKSEPRSGLDPFVCRVVSQHCGSESGDDEPSDYLSSGPLPSKYSTTHQNIRGRASCGLSLPIALNSSTESAYEGSQSEDSFDKLSILRHISDPLGSLDAVNEARPPAEGTKAILGDQNVDETRPSIILGGNSDTNDLLNDLLLEVALPTLPSSPSFGYMEPTQALSTPKAIQNAKISRRQSTVYSPSVTDNDKKPGHSASRSQIPQPLRRSQSKSTESGPRISNRHGKEDLAHKDEMIRQLRLKMERVEKERDDALRVLSEVQKMLVVGR